MKKYPLIAALVPAGEHFDESAIVNEGGYLSTSHLAAVEKKMGDDAAAISAHPTEIQSFGAQIIALNTAKEAAEASLAIANQTIESNIATIAKLQSEIVTLNKLPAKTPESTTKSTDDPVTTSGIKSRSEKYRTVYDEMAEKYIK